MPYQCKPTVDGTYLIKVLSEDLFIENVSGDNPKLQLSPPSSSDNQKWNLSQIPGRAGVWKMTCVEGGEGITYTTHKKRYWGYGHPHPHSGDSAEWNFIERDQAFSKRLATLEELNSIMVPTALMLVSWARTRAISLLKSSQSSGPNQCFVFELLPPAEKPVKALDVLFLQDFTYSQSPYIEKAKEEIKDVCNRLLSLSNGQLEVENLRFGLIAFRDHPPQDQTFVTKIFDFTTDPNTMASYLGSLTVEGGGDGPEAQCDALHDALNSAWNEKATKVAVLITDAPPHGLGESGDGFPNGCPCGYDPLQIAGEMLGCGITLVRLLLPKFLDMDLMTKKRQYVIACEPELSTSYKNARHFYEGLSRKTRGQVYNLGNPGGLTDVIVGCLMQEADSDTLVRRHQSAIRRDAESGELSPEEIAQRLHEDLSNANTSHYALSLDDMVEVNEEGEQNVKEWFEAANLTVAKGKLTEAPPNRIKPEYLAGSSPASSMGKKPITLTQVEGIVKKSLARRH
ncbi:unnamed protein product [Rhizoctonia solani]|uniref:Hemicentin-1-like von Willebrand factor A domain-containing protein n=1 Tax=Rhizoctonia solani TaxID=456999 RepID=A0A8H3C4C8_9AGAM|nr:unnamed protein product [Rhizoctonia solani]